jgi:hypothetical protein
MPKSSDDQFITLRGGVVFPVVALQLAWRLEAAGFTLDVVDGGAVRVRPASALTEADREAIRAWRSDLATIISYEVPSEVTV